MLIPLRTDSPLRSTPWVNWALILSNAIVYAVALKFPHAAIRYELNADSPKLYQYFTYAFLHANGPHLLFNMLFLYVFGNNVNDRMGNFGYLGFYLAGGVFSGIAYATFETSHVLGASGAIAAVTGAYLVLLPRSHITIVYVLLFIGIAEIPSLWLILGYYFLQDVAVQMFHGFFHSDNVAHVAHIGGTVFGFGVCMLMLALHLLPRDQFDVLALLQRWNRRRQYRGLVRTGYDPFGFVPPKRLEPDPNMERIQDLKAAIGEAMARHDLAEGVRAYLELQSIDPQQVLGRQNQLDIANQLYADGKYAPAATAYELFIKHHPKYENMEHVRLMLGILYSRYLGRYDAARDHLKQALERLHNDRDRDLARYELERIGPPQPPAAGASARPI